MSRIGSIEMVSADHPMTESGLVDCNGQSLLISEYQDLYDVIGDQYGGDETHFNVPTRESADGLKFGIVFKAIAPEPPEPDEEVEGDIDPTTAVSVILRNARMFSEGLMNKFILENIAMGITQAGKTKLVADYLKNLQFYLGSGSLYAAIAEIDELIENEIPENLSPYVTESRLTSYKESIEDYLGL